jgi:16S rRNA (guanine527-N7)-methyltransferase
LTGAGLLGVTLNEGQADQLVRFADLLVKWNKTFNLVSRADIRRLGSRHLLDSLAAVDLLRGARVMDLGSGAGLPGIPLAVAMPATHFVLCDRSERRVRFLQQVVRELALSNVEVWLGDIGSEKLDLPAFDTVVARGVATAPIVWDMVHAHLAEKGCVLVYESTQSDLELVDLPQNHEFRISRHSFDIPGLGQSHSIVCMEAA